MAETNYKPRLSNIPDGPGPQKYGRVPKHCVLDIPQDMSSVISHKLTSDTGNINEIMT